MEQLENQRKPVLLYDGDCGFCRYWVERWRHRTGDQVDYLSSQEAGVRFPQIQPEEFRNAVQLIQPDGKVSRGAAAVFQLLSHGRGRFVGLPRAAYELIPGFRPVTEAVYGVVARYRTFFSGLSRLFWGPQYQAPSYGLTRWVFLRFLGIIYLVAFASLWSQVMGLIGEKGILPAQPFLDMVRSRFGYEGTLILPTLCWISASDGMLQFLCAGGVVLSVALIVGFAPVPVLACLWLFYLSLVNVGQDFLTFQWDILLLETGFLAIFLAPLQLLPNYGREGPGRRTVIWLFRLLLFKLMFLSGLVKLTSGDPTWWNDMTALNFHYQTQPLPTIVGWWAQQLPAWFQKWSIICMFVIELGVPFLMFGPRKVRYLACFVLAGFQALIFFTGNYCFFNLLTLALCLLLLDDSILPTRVRDRVAAGISKLKIGSARSTSFGWPRPVVMPLAMVVCFMSTIALVRGFRKPVDWPWYIERAWRTLAPFHTFNGYGLFAVMTTKRPEIVLEGSENGVDWKAYVFKYKPGDVDQPPRWVQPHQPRLDWQMWFAALWGPERSEWFFQFCGRLLQGSPEVTGLLENNPFPDRPPRYLRAVLYDYQFTNPATRRETGEWWTRRRMGLYCPVLTIVGDRLLPIRQ